MNIKRVLKHLVLGLLVASSNGASMNCKTFRESFPEIGVPKCKENKRGKITEIYLNGILSTKIIKGVSSLTSLETFSFYHDSYQNDFDLSPLSKLEKLTYIDADCYRHPKHRSSGSEIDPHSFDNMKNLEKLVIDGCDIEGEKIFNGLTNLKELEIQKNRGESNIPDLGYLKNHKKLTSITFRSYYSPLEINTNFSEFKYLKKLSFEKFNIHQKDIENFSAMEGLEELIFDTQLHDDINFDSLAKLKNTLKTLVLNYGEDGIISDSILSLTNLEKLEIVGFENISNIIDKLPQLTNLKQLTLFDTKLTEIPESIKQLNNLEYLDLYANDIEEIPRNLTGLENLKYLNVSHNYITEIPDSINELKSLKSLIVDDSDISEISENIKDLKNLEELAISLYNTTLPESIKELKNLKTLTYRTSETKGVQEFPEILKVLTNLEELNLENQNIGKIPDYIKEFKKLKKLYLSDNVITEIPESLAELESLEVLDLYNNDIKELPEFLNSMKNLKDFNISYNKNLTGKTLTNENIESCNYYQTNLCINDINTPCDQDNKYMDLCDEEETQTQTLCDTINSYLKEQNILMDIKCKMNGEKIETITLDESVLSEEALNYIFSLPIYEDLIITVDNSKNALKKIGKEVVDIKDLTIISKVKTLSLSVLKNLHNLTYLTIKPYENELLSLRSNSFEYFNKLYHLILTNVNLSQTNVDEICKITRLRELGFNKCAYSSSVNFSNLKNLVNLELLGFDDYYPGKRALSEIPSSVYKLTNLISLEFNKQNISKISSKIANLTNLRSLYVTGAKLTTLPNALNTMENLTSVDFSDNPTLTGKTLTNDNLRTCIYDPSSSICKAKDIDCFDVDIKLC